VKKVDRRNKKNPKRKVEDGKIYDMQPPQPRTQRMRRPQLKNYRHKGGKVPALKFDFKRAYRTRWVRKKC